MSRTVSRREFLHGSSSIAVGAAIFAFMRDGKPVEQGNPSFSPATDPSNQAFLTSDIEKWLLETGRDELDTELYRLLADGVSLPYRAFLPSLER